MSEFNVLIIGAGNIEAFFDKPDSGVILTHAHAFCSTEGFKVIGFVDSDYEKAEKASLLWGGRAYKSINEVFITERVDIVSVAVPDEYHYPVLKKLSEYGLRLVFTEKPLTKSLIEAEEIIGLYQNNRIPMLINYSRRFVPELIRIKYEIANGNYGKYISGNGNYGKGVLHNGSHMVDLLRFLLGDITHTYKIDSIVDYYEDDPSVSGIMTLQDGQKFIMNKVDCRLYTLFEMDLLFERKRIRMLDSGFSVEEYSLTDSNVFKGYVNLGEVIKTQTSLGNAMHYATKNIYGYLKNEEKLKCTPQEAYENMKVCFSLKEGKE